MAASDSGLRASDSDLKKQQQHRSRLFSGWTICGLILLSIFLIGLAISFPLLQKRSYLNELRGSGAMVSSRVKYFEWIADWTGIFIPWNEEVNGIDFRTYRPTNRDLKALSRFPSLGFVGMMHCKVSEEAINEFVSKCLTLRQIQIVSCPQISPEFIENLKTSYPKLQIEYRGTAYLGLAAFNSDGQCIVSYLDPKMPAARAGLRRFDIMISFNKVPISNFQELVAEIGKCQPDEEVSLTYLRNGEKVTVPVTLTGWKR